MILINAVAHESLTFKFEQREVEYQRSRFKSVKCVSHKSAETVITIHVCRVKVTRNSSAVAGNVTFHSSFGPPIYGRGSVCYKYGQIYREIIRIPEMELCAALKNIKLLPLFAKAFFESLGDSILPIWKGCPYKGNIYLLATLDELKFPSIFPSGMYKGEVWLTNRKKSPMLYMKGEIEIVSNIKTSFK